MKVWNEVMIPTRKSLLFGRAMFDFELRVGIHRTKKRNFGAQLAVLRPFSMFSDARGSCDAKLANKCSNAFFAVGQSSQFDWSGQI